MNNDSGTGSVAFNDKRSFNGVKVFSATMMNDRAKLGDTVTAWIAQNPSVEITEIIVTQSSDQAFHCLAMTVFYYQAETE